MQNSQREAAGWIRTNNLLSPLPFVIQCMFKVFQQQTMNLILTHNINMIKSAAITFSLSDYIQTVRASGGSLLCIFAYLHSGSYKCYCTADLQLNYCRLPCQLILLDAFCN